jgi:small-conductance mechanosensitive channel
MSSLVQGSVTFWAAVLIVLLPALIIAAGELQERLRQRESALVQPVATIRSWVLPLAALYALVVLVFEVDSENLGARIIGTALIIALAIALLQFVGYLTAIARERAKVPGTRAVPQLLLALPRLLALLAAGWILFAVVWDVDLTGLFAALGVTSIVISVALQDTLSGLASGFLLLSDRPFSPGDWIEVNDIEGRVLDINWRSSKIQNRDGDLIVIPNSLLAGATIANYAEPARLHRVVVPVQVAYSNPPTRAKEMLLAAARATPGVLAEPPPTILVKQIDDPLMGYEAHLWIDDYTIAPRVFSDFGSLVWYQSHRMDVPLPSPAFDLYHHDPIREAADAELTPADIADHIRTAPLLTDLPAEDIEQLVAASRPVRFRLTPGVADRNLYVLWEGTARIVSVDAPGRYVELGAGEVFGILSQPSRDHEPPGVVAVDDCEVVIIDAEAAGAVTSRNPELTRSMNQLVTARLRRLEGPQERMQGAAVAEDVGAGASGDGEPGEEGRR